MTETAVGVRVLGMTVVRRAVYSGVRYSGVLPGMYYRGYPAMASLTNNKIPEAKPLVGP